MAECVPYYVDLFHQMKSEIKEPAVSIVTAIPAEG
jgi:3beta-hydroxy-delta5-steroid dehydrogenase/steroid delta-isomerase